MYISLFSLHIYLSSISSLYLYLSPHSSYISLFLLSLSSLYFSPLSPYISLSLLSLSSLYFSPLSPYISLSLLSLSSLYFSPLSYLDNRVFSTVLRITPIMSIVNSVIYLINFAYTYITNINLCYILLYP